MKTLSIAAGATSAVSPPTLARTAFKTVAVALALSLALALALPASVTSALAQTAADNPIALPTPALPAAPAPGTYPGAYPGAYPGEGIEPEVTIIETESEVITEYRIRGKLYMVKIDPVVGPPYFMFDTDGDGQLDAEEDRGVHKLSVPQWLLFSW